VIRTIILAAFGAMLIFMALRSLRAHRLKERYALLVGLMGLPFVGLAAWPDAVVYLSEKMNIEKPTLLLMALAGFLIIMIIQLLSLVSVLERKVTTLAQMLGTMNSDKAELDRRLRALEKKDQPVDNSSNNAPEKPTDPR
jgi:hypothetical protein